MEKISEKEAEERYKEDLEQTKLTWIENYYGGDVLKEIDTIGYQVGFEEFINKLEEEGIKVI